jgi:transcriptional regulator with XRE-family HTH domain
VDQLARQFGAVVRRRREAADVSQEALAEAAGLHRTYISMLERGVRMPSILVARQVAEALGTTLGALLTEVDREAAPKKSKKK